MRTRMVKVREGELLGPVDWSHNFRQYFDCYCCSEPRRDELCGRAKEFLRQISESPRLWRVTLAHSSVARDVYDVGMYDGWPYWKPTPALLTGGTLGPEWHFFYDITGIERIAAEAKA